MDVRVFSVLLQDAFPMLSSQQLVQRLYPYNSILGKDGRAAVEDVLSVSQSCEPPVEVHLTVASMCCHLHAFCGTPFFSVEI